MRLKVDFLQHDLGMLEADLWWWWWGMLMVVLELVVYNLGNW